MSLTCGNGPSNMSHSSILWLPGNCKVNLLSFQKREGRKEGADLENMGGVVRGGEDAALLHTRATATVSFTFVFVTLATGMGGEKRLTWKAETQSHNMDAVKWRLKSD